MRPSLPLRVVRPRHHERDAGARADPQTAVREVSRILRPGGYFTGSAAFLEPYHPHSDFHLAPDGVVHALEAAGLSVGGLWPQEEWLVDDSLASMPGPVSGRRAGSCAASARWSASQATPLPSARTGCRTISISSQSSRRSSSRTSCRDALPKDANNGVASRSGRNVRCSAAKARWPGWNDRGAAMRHRRWPGPTG